MDITKNKIDATLIFLVIGDKGHRKVLLAKKVRKIGVGCPNGFEGSFNKRETPRACAVRELKKESGLVALKKDLEFMGVVTFHNQREDKSEFTVRVFIFVLETWKGKLKLKKDEMTDPKWYKTYRLPLKKMMPGDKKFVPETVNGSRKDQIIRGEIWYGRNQKRLLGFDIKWVGKTCDVD